MKLSSATLVALFSVAAAAPGYGNSGRPPPPPPPPGLSKDYSTPPGKGGYPGQSDTSSGWIPLKISQPGSQGKRPSSPPSGSGDGSSRRPSSPPSKGNGEYELPLPPVEEEPYTSPEEGRRLKAPPPPPPPPPPSGGKCTPATYACATNSKSGGPGWKVCDVSGSFVVSETIVLHIFKEMSTNLACFYSA